MNPATPALISSPRRPLPRLTADGSASPWPGLAATLLKTRGTGEEPPRQTWVKSAWSPEEWRLLFFAKGAGDAPGRIGVSFDPVGDGVSFFEIGVSPDNRAAQAVYRACRSGFKKNTAWQCTGFQSAVRRAAEGWFAEFAIPFAGLGPIRPPAPWRACFWREPASPAPGDPRTAWPPGIPLALQRPGEFGVVEWVDA